MGIPTITPIIPVVALTSAFKGEVLANPTNGSFSGVVAIFTQALAVVATLTMVLPLIIAIQGMPLPVTQWPFGYARPIAVVKAMM